MGTVSSCKDYMMGIGVKATGVPVGSEVHSGQHVNQADLMNCDPPAIIVNSNCTAETEREGLDRMDTAAPCEGYVAPLPLNLNPFGGTSPYSLTNFLLYHQSFQAERGQNTSQVFIDGVRYLEHVIAKTLEATSQKFAEYDATHQSQLAEMSNKYQQQLTAIESISEDKVQALSSSNDLVSKKLKDAEAQMGRLTATEMKVNDRNSTLHQTNDKLYKENEQLKISLEKQEKDLKAAIARINGLEDKFRFSTSAVQAKEKEVQRLNSVILEKDKANQDLQSVNTRLNSDCQKLKDKTTEIEKKSAQESVTSGSYAEGHANPGLLVTACQTIDTATEKLARLVHEKSIWSSLPLKSPKMETFVSFMSRASVGDFSRPAQVKQVWAHWFCSKMYQGFENVFFDVGEERTSPLDPKNHAAECYRSFQKMQGMSSIDFHEDCKPFQQYCHKMYSLLFLTDLGDGLSWSDSVTFHKNGRFDGDGELYAIFLELAKAIWSLHELAFSFDPPASILRIGWGEPFDRKFHDSVIKESDSDLVASKVVLMARPAFRLKNAMAMKSRVFLSKKP